MWLIRGNALELALAMEEVRLGCVDDKPDAWDDNSMACNSQSSAFVAVTASPAPITAPAPTPTNVSGQQASDVRVIQPSFPAAASKSGHPLDGVLAADVNIQGQEPSAK